MKTFFTVIFLTLCQFLVIAQTSNPQALSFSPADEATDVEIDANLSVTFDEAIEINTVWEGGNQPILRLRRLDNDAIIQAWTPSTNTTGLSVDGSTFTIDPNSDLLEGVSYYVEISWRVIQDLEGNYFDGFSDNATWNFTTVEPDVTAPLITNTTPYDGSNYFFLSGGLSINFNEDIQEGSGNVILYDAEGNTLETVTTGVNDSRITNYTFRTAIDFSTEIEEATVYMVSVDAGSWTDLAGNPCNAIAKGELSFTSTSRPHIQTLSPADDEIDVDASSTLSIQFDTHVWANDPAALILIDYDSEDTLETFDLTALGDGGDFADGLITLTPTSSLPEGTHLAVLANPVGALRSSSNSEQFIQLDDKDDWDFTTQEPDTEAPTITSITEIEDGVYDKYVLHFTINFSEPIEIDDSYNMFRLGIVSPSVLSDISSYITEVTDTSITFQLGGGLRQGRVYYIYVDPSAVSDLAGNAFAGVTSSLTYRFQALWDQPEVISRTPAASKNQVIDSDIVIEFNEDILLNGSYDPSIAALRLIVRPSNANIETYTISQIQVSGSTLTIDKTVDLDLATTYSIMIPQGVIMAAADTTRFFNGYNSTGDWEFTTEYNYWDGTQWALGTPATGDHVIFKDDYDFAEGEVLDFGLVYVYPGVDFSIENNATLRHIYQLYNSGDITIESGSSLNSQSSFLPSEGSSLTVKRNTTGGIGDGKYSFIGSPFASYDFTTIEGDYKYEYKQLSNIYADASNETSMTIGKGYTIANNDVLEFVGLYPATGSVTSYIRNSGEGLGYNLVSNPFTAALSYDALMAAEGPDGTGDITSTIYIWDDAGAGEKSQSDFITVNTLGSVSGGSGRSADFNDHIGVAQGFFVESTKASTQLNFSKNMLVNGNNADANYFRSDKEAYETAKIALVDKDEVRSEILIGWVNDADPGYDYKYDSRKLIGNEASQLYMPLDNKQLAIQGVPEAYDMPIDIAIDIKEAGEYAFDMVELNSSRQLLLYDSKMDVYHDLSLGSYEFYASKGVDKYRFEIFSSSKVLKEELDFNQIYAADNFLHIQMNDNAEVDVLVYALDGQLVLKTKTKGSDIIDMNSYSKGVYVVSAGDQSRKIIIK